MTINEKGESIIKMIARKEMVDVDRWGHVKFKRITKTGVKTYRYKLMKNVIRFEVKIDETGSWVRLKTYNINKLYDTIKDKIDG